MDGEDRSFEENLGFGVNLLQSLEFPIISKYQVLLDYFNNNVGQYRKEVQKTDPHNFETRWKIVNKFLAVEFPHRAVSSSTLENLLEIIAKEAEKVGKHPNSEYLNSFLTILVNNSFKHFFKFNSERYGIFVGKLLSYCLKLNSVKELPEDGLTTIFNDLSKNVKSANINTDFRKIFFDNVLTPLTSLSPTLAIKYRTDVLVFLQQLYFLEENLEKYTTLFQTGENKSEDLINVFDSNTSCKENILLCLEGFFRTYKTVPTPLIEFLFERHFNPATENFPTEICLSFIKEFFCLLQKYELKISRTDIVDEFNPVNYVQEKLESICNDYYDKYLVETMEVVIAVIQYNPLLIERKAFSVLTNCMFIEKPIEAQATYETFINSIIRMTVNLKRGEYFVVYLAKAVREKFTGFKVPKRSKRKDNELTVKKGLKKKKLDNGEALDVSVQENSNDGKKIVSRFEDINYAWPYTTTESEFAQLINSLTPKQSVTVWRLLTEFLSDELEEFEPSDENQLFKIELFTALLCQFLSNTELAENIHAFIGLIDERVQHLRDILEKFGRKILQMEHNRRLVSCFLNICYDFGFCESMIWHYRPDSCSIKAIGVTEHKELIYQDSKKQARLLHSYLSTEEWKLIEQRVKNFGKFECIRCMNWINLQNIHVALIFGDKKLLKKQWDTLATGIVEDGSLIPLILETESINYWFFENLNQEQMVTACTFIAGDEKYLDVIFKTTLLQNENFSRTLTNELLKQVFDNKIPTVEEIVNNLEQKSTVKYNELPLHYLNRLPLGFLDLGTRLTCFFSFIKIINCPNPSKGTVQAVDELLTTLVNFDECPDILAHISITQLFTILHANRFDKLLQLILNQTIFYMTEGAYEAYKKFLKNLKKNIDDENAFKVATKILKTLSTIHFLKSKSVDKEELEKLHYKLADLMYERLVKVTGEEEVDVEVYQDTCECLQAVIKSYIGRKNKTDDQVAGHNELLQKYLTNLVSF